MSVESGQVRLAAIGIKLHVMLLLCMCRNHTHLCIAVHVHAPLAHHYHLNPSCTNCACMAGGWMKIG